MSYNKNNDSKGSDINHDPVKQQELNFNYLFQKMEEIHNMVCPDEIGVWQEKPIQIIKALIQKGL